MCEGRKGLAIRSHGQSNTKDGAVAERTRALQLSRNVFPEFAKSALDLIPLIPGSITSSEDKVELRVLRKGERRRAVVSKAHGVIIFLQPAPEHLRHSLFIFDDQDLHAS